ncbi:pentatricopeptide repeat-containing protein At5g11310, mitochondrial [Sesamum indicum]|uniref:Pentatricopeptide repeat-containing protein At5g11310, mitochondrial n=1 Tax=Sesamum indicum TaxID=4182 RepID=A0A6I9TG69_SESIN|nr:pentatricopeptide repeat-containing protein At5g11310, mitochondrial [Sesamum indicum]
MNIRRSVFSLAAAGAARRLRLLSTQSSFSIPIPLLNKNPPHPPSSFPQNPDSAALSDFTRISELLSNPSLQPGDGMEEALTAAQISPSPNLLLQIFSHFDSTPKPLFTLFNWAQKRPDFQFSMAVFNAMVNSLGKAREFDSAWCLILDQIKGDPSRRPDSDTFLIMIRRYARAGLPLAAIRTFEYASSLDFLRDLDPEKNLFETLLDALCKEGHVRAASQYVDKHRAKDPSWLPPIRIYNILLNGWCRSRRLKHAKRLWVQMKKENVKPTVVTYGTIIEGLCRMRLPDMAMELLNEMKAEGVEPNAIVYNPIIDALGEAGRFEEALGMLERFSILELGPTISTYNSLVKGFCKAGDLVEASKILKMMIDNKCLPTPTTYSYFFKYFSKVGKTEAGLNLYTKMIRSGYEPDRLTYHLLVKMLCKEGKLDLTVQIIKEMRARGFDLDLASSTMLMHLLWRMRRYDEAVSEFQDVFRRGIIPQHLTYRRMAEELERQGMIETSQKLHDLMKSVPHSTKLPDTYKGYRNSSHERKISIIQRAEAMSDILKTCENPRELVKHKNRPENSVLSAQKLMDSIQRKSNLRHLGQDPSIPSLSIEEDILSRKVG